MARPRKEIDVAEFDKLCAIQCTKTEIAWFFGVSEDTLSRRIQEECGESFADYYKKASSEGKMSLRRKQFELAMKGNTTLCIWLGKQYLGQSDKLEQYDADNPAPKQDDDGLWNLRDPNAID